MIPGCDRGSRTFSLYFCLMQMSRLERTVIIIAALHDRNGQRSSRRGRAFKTYQIIQKMQTRSIDCSAVSVGGRTSSPRQKSRLQFKQNWILTVGWSMLCCPILVPINMSRESAFCLGSTRVGWMTPPSDGWTPLKIVWIISAGIAVTGISTSGSIGCSSYSMML